MGCHWREPQVRERALPTKGKKLLLRDPTTHADIAHGEHASGWCGQSTGGSRRAGRCSETLDSRSKQETSLVVQWLRIHLLMQRTQFQSLVRKDPTCCKVSKPMHHDCWACVLLLVKPMNLEPVFCNKGTTSVRSLRPQWRVAPPSATRESPRAATKTKHGQK